MKFCRIFIILFSIISLQLQSQTSEKFYSEEDIEEVQNYEFTKYVITNLASPYYEGRDILSSSISNTYAFIENEFRLYNIKSYFNQYRRQYKIKDSIVGQNIVGVYRGNEINNQAILILANYDNLGMENEGDKSSYYAGANDNASGVAGVLQMIRFFTKVGCKENIIFALTSGKYYDMIGTGMLADDLQKNGILNIKYAINLEMLGRPVKGEYWLLSIQDTTNNISNVFNEYMGDQFVRIDEIDHNQRKSEHSSIYNVMNIPTTTLTCFDLENDENYMSTNDDIDNIDLWHLHRTINKISLALFQTIYDKRRICFSDKCGTTGTKPCYVKGNDIDDIVVDVENEKSVESTITLPEPKMKNSNEIEFGK